MTEATRGGLPKIDGNLPSLPPEKVVEKGRMGARSVQQVPEKQPPSSVEIPHVSSISQRLQPAHTYSTEKLEEHRIRPDTEKVPDAEILRKWSPVKELFENAISTLRGSQCIPEGSAAYIRLILPEDVERVLGGPLEFRAGSTSLHGPGNPISDTTLANIGSSGKPITCILAAVLKQQGYIRFSDSICRYFPKEVMKKFQKDCFGSPVNPSEITVEMLLHMTAGLAYSGLAGIDESTPEERARLPYDKLLRRSMDTPSIPFTSRPGDRICTYSNLQMQLLSYAIEKAYKEKSIKTLIETRPGLANLPLRSLCQGPEIEKLPQNITLRQFVDLVSDTNRQTSYINDVYIYDVIDQIIEKENPSDACCSFETILQNELFQPLGIKEAAYAPSKAAIAEGRVLAMPAMGDFPLQDNSRNGAGTLYMTPVDETKLLRALMKPALVRGSHVLVDRRTMTDLFTPEGKNLNMPQWSVGGTRVDETATSYSIGKGGELDQYKHFFKWERMKDVALQNEGIGFFFLEQLQQHTQRRRIWSMFGEDVRRCETPVRDRETSFGGKRHGCSTTAHWSHHFIRGKRCSTRREDLF